MDNKQKTNPDEPIQTIEYNNNYISNGLTKREYFAAMALQGLLATNSTTTIEYYAIDAVRIADALIDELNK
jgi:hypothetical protein